MATQEIKPKTKKTEEKQKQSSQIKPDLPPQEEPPLPLPYKSCSLKVSIHCEGCKRKVKKILTTIEGVCKVDIDVKQHKVTVLGITSPEILLMKLHKSGKKAELLPDPVQNKPKPADPNKNNKKVEKLQQTDESTSSGTDKLEKSDPVENKPKPVDPNKKNKKADKDSGTDKLVEPDAGKCDKQVSEKIDGGVGGSGDGGENATDKEEKKDCLKEKDSDKELSPSEPAAEKKAEETGGAGNGKVGKKKKKKGQNLATTNDPTGGLARTQSAPPPTTADHDRSFDQINDHPIITNNIPPRHDMYPYPPPSYYAPQVMYGVSYNVAQAPLHVDAASYYTPPPPYSYAYMHPGYQPYDQNAYPSRPSDSYEFFSDENPNGCTVM